LEGAAGGMLYVDDGESLVPNATLIVDVSFYRSSSLPTRTNHCFTIVRAHKLCTLRLGESVVQRHESACEYHDLGPQQTSQQHHFQWCGFDKWMDV
jgi:hypothetical protein